MNVPFRARVDALVAAHPVVVANPFTSAFARGGATSDDVRKFAVQFSVFSHLFIEAQLRKCLNAETIESYRAAKEILMNELGVAFGRGGSVDGSRFRFDAAHFEWLARFCAVLGLDWNEIGKRRLGTPATLAFCDTLIEVYGAEDSSTAAGASYAIEHWAAAGFWKELIAGLRAFRTRACPELPLAFWTFHDALEDQHAAHTADELDAMIAQPGFDEEGFLAGARAVLDATWGFWIGLLHTTSVAGFAVAS